MNIAFAGGVTGGHIAPGVALAQKILAERPGSSVLFASVANETEQRMIARAGLPLARVTPRSRGRTAAALHVPTAFYKARRLFGAFRPDAVVGLGGGASVGGALAAIIRRTPLVLLEQNLIPGLANRRLAPWATHIFCQWQAVVPEFNHRAVFSGSPVRAEILRSRSLDKAQSRALFGLRPDLPTLLVMGGSQGARPINLALAAAAPRLAGRIQIIHLAGDQNRPGLAAAYHEAGLAAHVCGFLEAMHLAYAASDLAISRSGATSLAELAAAGLPAVLIPFPQATDDHQRANALAAVGQRWAVLLDQSDLGGDTLVTLLDTLFSYRARLDAMKEKARAAARDDAADYILDALDRLTARSNRTAVAAGHNAGG